MKNIFCCLGIIFTLIIFFYALMMVVVSDDINDFIREEVKCGCIQK